MFVASFSSSDVFPISFLENLQGLGFRHISSAAFDVLKKIFAMDEANYPEILGSYNVVNAPGLFSVVYKMLRPFIDKNTLEKVRNKKEETQSLLIVFTFAKDPCFLKQLD